MKPVCPRSLARADVEQIIDCYAQEAGEDVALRFVGALESVYTKIGSNPASGSPRFAHELSLPGLRSQSLKHFPYLVFYLDREDHVDVWRVLHVRRDVPAWLLDDSGIA